MDTNRLKEELEELQRELEPALRHFEGVLGKKSHAILDKNGNIVPVGLMEWAHWFEKADRVIQQEEIGDYFISTVFLGLNHQYTPDEPPLWFETMVFSPEHEKEIFGEVRPVRDDLWCRRCSTLAQAKEMHEEACAWLRANVLISG